MKFVRALLTLAVTLFTSFATVPEVRAAVVQVGSPAQINNNTTLSYTVPAGTNRLLVVNASGSDLNNLTNITGVTFNGTPMILGVKRDDTSVAVDSLWYLPMGTSGSTTPGTIAATVTGGSVTALGAITFQNVDQAAPMNGTQSGILTGTNVGSTLAVPSNPGDLVMDLFDIYDPNGVGTENPGGGQTVLHDIDAPGGNLFGYYKTSTKAGAAPSVAMSWTSNGQAMIHVAANIKQAAVPFTPGNLIVVRLGTGSAVNSTTDSTPVFLDEYTTTGSLVQSIPVPTTGTSQLTMAGATLDGLLTRSQDGQRLYFGGYRTGVGTVNVGATAPATVNRVLAYVDPAGAINTVAASTDAAGAMRAVTSVGGSGDIYFQTASGGVRRMAGHGNVGATTQIDTVNGREVLVSGNVLYGANTVGSSTAKLVSYGTLPTGATAPTAVLTLGGSAGTSGVHGFVVFDLSTGVAGDDTIYATDVTGHQLVKYCLVSGSWTAAGSVTLPTGIGISVTGSVSGSTVTLYVVDAQFGGAVSSIQKITDASGFNGTLSGSLTTIASAPTNKDFRGIAFAPSSASSNADLNALSFSAGSIAPAFAAGTTSYSFSVANGTTSTTVTATRADANATLQVQVNGGGFSALTSGTPSGSLSLNAGANTVDVKVTAQNGTTIKTYTTTITRAASNNADLSALSFSAGSISPAFVAGTTSYSFSVANGTTSTTVTGTRADANATLQVQVNGGGFTALTSGSPSGVLALGVGANTVNVKVTAQDGTTIKAYTTTITRQAPAPTVTNVAPSSGPAAGGTSVTITGTDFTGATAVTFGGNPAAGITVVNATTIMATTPAHAAGAVSVVVTTPGGANGANTAFTYLANPDLTLTVTHAPATFIQGQQGTLTLTANNTGGSPTAGTISINGTLPGGLVISSISTDATWNFTSSTSTVLTGTRTTALAAGASSVITVTVNVAANAPSSLTVNGTISGGGESNTGNDTGSDTIPVVSPPTVTNVSPSTGTTAGGTSVTISGTNFTGATAVTMGGNPAASVTVVNATTITATTPAHAAGVVNVVVTTPGGTGTGTNLFTYLAPPTVTSISPTSGATAGGTSVTITGTNFTGATAVTFGGNPAAVITVVNATTITASTPAHAAGAVSVVVTTPGGTNGANTAFTYVVGNSPPSDVTLLGTSITENNPAGATIGTLSATDPDGGQTHTFALVAGIGGDDNGAFTITGNTLTINGVADFETQSSYHLRIRATDNGAPPQIFDKVFTITVTDVTLPQTITFGPLGGKTFGDAAFTVSATGGASGQSVTFGVSGSATIVGNTVTLTGAGPVTVTASQAGANDYGAATPVPQSFTVAKAAQTIGFTLPASAAQSDSLALTATGGASGQPVTLLVVSGPGSITTNTLTFTGPGDVLVRASQAGDSNYFAATDVEATVHVTTTAGLTLVDDAVTTTSGDTTVYPLANDRTGNAGPLSITAVSNPAVTISGRALIVPTGTADFTYSVTDGTANATANVVVIAGNPLNAPGHFNGLLRDASGALVGWAKVTISARGYATAQARVGSQTGHGKFTFLATGTTGSGATALGTISITRNPDGTADLSLATPGGPVTGPLRASRGTGPAQKFHVALASIDSAIPGGGFAVASVKASGVVNISGQLPDGRPLSASSEVGDNGTIAFFAAENKGVVPAGQFGGELVSANLPTTDVTGDFVWSKPQQAPGSKGTHLGGVDTILTANGSLYNGVIPLTGGGTLTLAGGNLAADETSAVTVTAGVPSAPSGALIGWAGVRATIGKFRVRVKVPSLPRPVTGGGIYLPKSHSAWGYFPGSTLGGRVELTIP